MQSSGYRGARGVFAAATLTVLLSVVLASQAPPPPPPQGRGQPPPQLPPIREAITVIGDAFQVLSTTPGRAKFSDFRVLVPADNVLTEARVELGRKLFFDPVLSRDRSVSCSTCHKPEFAFADDKTLAVGIFGRVGKRHSPSIVNRGLGRTQFWDGRAATLEQLALMPLLDEKEMDLPPAEAAARLSADPAYRAAFEAAFGRGPSTEDMSRAIASFVRVIRSEGSAYDRFIEGDTTALTDEQKRGLELFRGRGRCFICHTEPAFTDENFHNTGVAWRPNTDGPGGTYQDDGRFAASRFERERGAFKTPTLRDIARTAPYMHDGSLATLTDVVSFYEKGGRPNPNLFQLIRPLSLTPEEKAALVKFLEALSGNVTTSVLPRELVSPDFSGTWVPRSPAAGPAGTPWAGSELTIVQSQNSMTVLSLPPSAGPAPRLSVALNGTVRNTFDRSRPAGLQQVSTRASWKDWQLAITTTEQVKAADGAVVKQDTTSVLSLESATTLRVLTTRTGTPSESWTVTYQKKAGEPR